MRWIIAFSIIVGVIVIGALVFGIGSTETNTYRGTVSGFWDSGENLLLNSNNQTYDVTTGENTQVFTIYGNPGTIADIKEYDLLEIEATPPDDDTQTTLVAKRINIMDTADPLIITPNDTGKIFTYIPGTRFTHITKSSGGALAAPNCSNDEALRALSNTPEHNEEFNVQRYEAASAGHCILQGDNDSSVMVSIEETEFNESGNLATNIPGLPNDTWYLVYDEQGQPGRFAPLLFDDQSICAIELRTYICDDALLHPGDRVTVGGKRLNDSILVRTLGVTEREQ